MDTSKHTSQTEPAATPSSSATSGGKRQPWKSVWPAQREPLAQAGMLGFKKGEEMVFDGNTGSFFVKDGWEVSRCAALISSKVHLLILLFLPVDPAGKSSSS